MQEAQDTIIHSKVPPLSVQWELKSTCCQVQWHSCFPFAPVEPVSGGRTNQSSLEITHFLLHNYKAASRQREEKRDVCMNFLSALWVQLLRNNATQKCQHFADVLANNIMSGTMASRFSALARACNCNCQVSLPFALTFNSYLTWHTHGAGGAVVSLYRTHNLLPTTPQFPPPAPYLSQRIQSLLSVSDKCSCSSDWLWADCGSALRLGGSSPSALRLDIEMFHAIMKTSLLASSPS